jgi:predicted nucleic acid-binding Zn ribbon protein
MASPVRDLDEMVAVANELLDAAERLDLGVGDRKADRDRILRRVTALDEDAGQPFRVNFGEEVTIYAGKKRPKGGPELAFGLVPSDAALVNAVRWAAVQFLGATTKGHFGVDVGSGTVSPVAADAYGAATLAIAQRLTQGRPASLLVQRRRPCAWCGKEITYQRSTRRFCSSACQRAVMRARQRTREEDAR